MFERDLTLFTEHLVAVRGLSRNTTGAYLSDLHEFREFLEGTGVTSWREVDVLSMSTTPTGISTGTPSPIIDVKKNMTSNGNATMQNQQMGFLSRMRHSRRAMCATCERYVTSRANRATLP